MSQSTEQTCPGCGQTNGCAVAAGRSPSACWCMGSSVRLPLPEDETDTSCYCESCLQRIATHLRATEQKTDAR